MAASPKNNEWLAFPALFPLDYRTTMKINPFYLMNILLPSLATVMLSLSQARAESRHALVIGNNAYQNARALVNPKNDAIAIAAKLRAVGFDVTERTDATNKGMKDALREFSGKVPEGSVCLIYYAGHGVQIKGQNYLVPIDAKMAAEYEVPDETLCMDTVVRALGKTKSKLNIFVLDCCRDDPFARSWKGSRSVGSSGGLVMPADMPQGMFVAFSTSPNTTAEDGDGKNSPYATALLEELGQPGLDFEKVFKNVGAKVVKATNGRQEPWSNSKFYGDFSFVISSGTSPTGNPTPTATGSSLSQINQSELTAKVMDGTAGQSIPMNESQEKPDAFKSKTISPDTSDRPKENPPMARTSPSTNSKKNISKKEISTPAKVSPKVVPKVASKANRPPAQDLDAEFRRAAQDFESR